MKHEDGRQMQGFRREIKKAANRSNQAFFIWFDSASDTKAAFVRGAWDFSLHIALSLAPYVSGVEASIVQGQASCWYCFQISSHRSLMRCSNQECLNPVSYTSLLGWMSGLF